IIDAHTHAYTDSELSSLVGRSDHLDGCLDEDNPNKWSLRQEPTIEGLLESEREAGIDRFVLLPVTSNPKRVRELNRWVGRVSTLYPQVIPFGTALPSLPDLDSVLDEIVLMGMVGVKIHPFLQQVDLLSWEAYRLFRALEERGLILTLDTMNLKGLKRFKPHLSHLIAGLDHFTVSAQRIYYVASRFPRLQIVAAHMGCLYGWDEIEPLLELSNVYFDTSFVSGIIEDRQVAEIMEKRGMEHMLFGSDAPWRRPKDELQWLRSLGISQSDMEMVEGGNFLRLLTRLGREIRWGT
ncbi:MAG: amidohydrolase family protein, partial [Desulfatiglandales bacterium]